MHLNVHCNIFTIARPWKQSKCPLVKEWINMWNIYTMENYSVIKLDEIMPFVATWMNMVISLYVK